MIQLIERTHLADHLRRIDWTGRILILKFGHQEIQKVLSRSLDDKLDESLDELVGEVAGTGGCIRLAGALSQHRRYDCRDQTLNVHLRYLSLSEFFLDPDIQPSIVR